MSGAAQRQPLGIVDTELGVQRTGKPLAEKERERERERERKGGDEVKRRRTRWSRVGRTRAESEKKQK